MNQESVTQTDLRHAMETLDAAFRSLNTQFRFGKVLDNEPFISAQEKYLCAALLGPIVIALDRVWTPLLKRLPKRVARRH